ncbi:MAG: alpha/beta hydrolase [Bacteroidetes bacterium]|nr:MAG: alpha/beta hydrolase [Bacteroidota bacterium]
MKIIKRILLLLLVIIVVVGIYSWVKFLIYNQETKTMNASARNTTGQFIELTAGITHYESGGVDTAKAIILVHGFSVPYYIWDGTYDSLAKAGFHVIRYDEFGRGFSDRPNVVYDPVFYRTQLHDLVTSLKLKTPVSLAGVSFGGAVVSDFAAHFPQLIDKIILVDPVYAFGKIEAPEIVANYKMAIDHEKQAKGQLDDFKYPGQFLGWVDKYKVQMQYKGFRHALISTRNNYSADSIISNYQVLGGLQKKILLIWGKEDQTVLFQYSDSLRKIVPVDFFPVDDAAHLPYLEKPALVNQKIISFLKEE